MKRVPIFTKNWIYNLLLAACNSKECPQLYESSIRSTYELPVFDQTADRIIILSDSNFESTSFDGHIAQTAITCLKLTIETLEQGVKYVQS